MMGATEDWLKPWCILLVALLHLTYLSPVQSLPAPIRATDAPVEHAALHSPFFATSTTEPEMVPVSSTVITVVNHKPPAARQSSANYHYSRRFRFYDKSSKPDEPLPLITKGSSLKAFYASYVQPQ